MPERLWGVLPLLVGLSYVLMSRDRLRREAERGARQAGQVFPWMSERSVTAEARTQYLLLRVIPPVFVVLGVLILLGVVDVGAD